MGRGARGARTPGVRESRPSYCAGVRGDDVEISSDGTSGPTSRVPILPPDEKHEVAVTLTHGLRAQPATLTVKLCAIADRTLLLLSLSVLMLGCQSADTPPQPTADLIFKYAAVCTMDAERSWQTALAVSRGRIQYVGGDAGALSLQGPKTSAWELQGKRVPPGLRDAHLQLAGAVL